MAASSSLPLAIIIFLLVLLAFAVPATAGGEYSGARMVIIRSPTATRVGVGAAGAQSNKWRHHYDRRLVEDEVAPELGGLLGEGEGSIGYGAVTNKNEPACPRGNQGCAAKGPGQPYTRGCAYPSQCTHTPSGIAN